VRPRSIRPTTASRSGESLRAAVCAAPCDFIDHPARHGSAEVAIRSRLVARDADLETGIEHDRDRQRTPSPGDFDPGFAIRRSDVGRVYDGDAPVLESLLRDDANNVEGVHRRRRVGRVIADQGAVRVGGNHLGGREPAARERRFAGAGRADQHDEREVRNFEQGRIGWLRHRGVREFSHGFSSARQCVALRWRGRK
jgi:hypothetical protein